MIHVVAVLTAKPGKREEIFKHFRANVPAVRAETGCIEYGPAVDAENALKARAAAPHMAAYAAKVKDLIASRTIHILQPA
jgi:quinol monooxygenase YgiN